MGLISTSIKQTMARPLALIAKGKAKLGSACYIITHPWMSNNV